MVYNGTPERYETPLRVLVAEDDFEACKQIVTKLKELGVVVVGAVASLHTALEIIDNQTGKHPRSREPIPRLAAVLFDANLHNEEIREGEDARVIDQRVREANENLGPPFTLRVGISASPMRNFGVAPDVDPGKHPYQIHLALAKIFPTVISPPTP